MCHVLLALPLVALPVFWVFPMSVAGPIYAIVIALTGAVYWFAIRAMRQPRQNGIEGMLGEFGVVVEGRGQDILVQARNELWQATSDVLLCKGDRIRVCSVEHMILHVERVEGDGGRWWQPAPSGS